MSVKNNKNDSEAFWRGMAEETGKSNSSGEQQREQVLLLVSSQGNRKLLNEHLQRRYQVVLPNNDKSTDSLQDHVNAPFDLAVVDAGGVRRWRQTLIEARSQAQPVFLPVMLIASQHELPHALRACGPHIDEFLITPVDPSELTHRVDMLLRARRQALTQSTRLAYLTSHDQSTGLPNKLLFLDRLSQAIQEATVLGRQVYAIVVHISLAPVLKSLGNHALEGAGQACSERLSGLLRDHYSLARLSTEEWGLMLRAGSTTDDALEAFRQIRKLESLPIHVGNERVHVTPSVGIAIYPEDATDAHTLLDYAGAALARTELTSRPAFYSRNVQRQALSQIRTEAGLHEALAREQFELWFQPKVSLADRSTTGAEALIRWRLSSGELVPPDNFIPVAEKTGLICQIDRWVLSKACEHMRDWKIGYGHGQISVNVSAQHLDTPDFVENVEKTLNRFGVTPLSLELELTETTLADLGQENLDKLHSLRRMGVGIALDDFGTGYCSLSYLHKLPITTLKIDKCFIDDIATDTTNAAITHTIVSLAKNFKLKLVAEGIETEEQCRCLEDLDIETGQGYLFARPMPCTEFERWITRSSRAREQGHKKHSQSGLRC